MIHDPFSEEFFWFDEPEWDSHSLDSWESENLDPGRDQWGWDEWGSVCVFRPQGYEPQYRYPLIVWLSVDEPPQQALRDWFPDLSDRNYISVGIEIQRSDSFSQNADRVAIAIREVAALYGIHPGRVWIAGCGPAAEWSLWLLPHLSRLVSGAIALLPWIAEPLEQPALQAAVNKNLFLVSERGDANELADRFAEYWEMCGGDQDSFVVDSLMDNRLSICRELNRWLMRQVSPAANW